MFSFLPRLWPLGVAVIVIATSSPVSAQYESFVPLRQGGASSQLKPPANIPPQQIAKWMLEHSKARLPKPKPHQESTNYVGLMTELENSGDYDELISWSEKEAIKHPRDGRWNFYIGRAYFWKGDFQTAFTQWNKAVSLNPHLAAQINPFRAQAARIRRDNPTLRLRPIIKTPSDVSLHQQSIYNRVLPLQNARRWAELDAVCDGLQGVGLDDYSDLCIATDSLANPHDRTVASWSARKALLESWVKSRPQSRWAKNVLFKAWIEHAWNQRGADWGAKVTPERWTRANDALKHAVKVAATLPSNATNTPIFYRSTISLLTLAGSPVSQIRQVYSEGVRRFPGDRSLDFAMAWVLLPRWYGGVDEMQRFLAQRADAIGGERGDIAYAQMVVYISDFYDDAHFWSQSGLNWPRAKRGFEAVLHRHPESVSLASWLLVNAQMNHDRFTSHAMVLRLNNRANSNIWSNIHSFALLRVRLLDPASE